jgi:uncharacterized alpha/beta hydrolase family protein
MKKLFASTIVALVLLIVLASTTFAAPTASGQQLLFKGSLESTETQQAVFPTLYVSATGSGNATQLGKYAYHFQGQINIPILVGTTSVTFTAADGSTLSAEGAGQGTPTSNPVIVSIVETYTISGGTGRFAGAGGSFTVKRLLNRATGVSTGTISGSILLP